VLEQVNRGLRQQQEALDNLRARAGTTVTAASVVSTVLGAAALTRRHYPVPLIVFTVLALLAFAVALASSAYILWPYDWAWGISGDKLLVDYVEADPPADLDEMRRSLAFYIQRDMILNRRQLDRLYSWLRVAVASIALEVVTWSLALVLR